MDAVPGLQANRYVVCDPFFKRCIVTHRMYQLDFTIYIELDFSMDRRTKRRIAITLLFIALGTLSAGILISPLWGRYVDFWLINVIQPAHIFSLPALVAVPFAILTVMLPVFALGAGLGLAARSFVRLKETEISSEYIEDISVSLIKLESASTYFQNLALSIEEGVASAERLKMDIYSLRELKAEDSKKLQSKFRLIRGASMPMLVLSHTSAFVAGVAMSIAGN